MKVSANCLQVVEYFETCKLKAYPDPKTGDSPWTCGWGATGAGIGPGTCWTQSEADTRLARDLVSREDDATNAIKVPVTQGQFDAFVSILFNVGHGSPVKDGIIRLCNAYPSTLLRKLNAGDYAGAREQFERWISPGTSVSHGLRRRRAAEQALFDGKSGSDAIKIGVML